VRCVLSTIVTDVLDGAWCVPEQVAVRPERFGALLYHFGTRRLSFLKSPELVRVVEALGDEPSALAACRGAGIPDARLGDYERALATLADTDMIRERA
jgi:putative mycofactocin binding protein MftB